MDHDTAASRLKAHETELRPRGNEHLYLFGSTARNEARPHADIDLFFDHPKASLGLYDLLDIKQAATQILGRKAEIMTRRSLHPVLRARIEPAAQRVF